MYVFCAQAKMFFCVIVDNLFADCVQIFFLELNLGKYFFYQPVWCFLLSVLYLMKLFVLLHVVVKINFDHKGKNIWLFVCIKSIILNK